MECDYRPTSEQHKSGRTIIRCRRPGCDRFGLLPLSGKLEHLHMECRGWPYRHEWGYWLALLLEAMGVSKRRWRWLQWKLGLVEVPVSRCGGCTAREKWLNTLGGRLCSSTRWWARLAAWMLVRRKKDTT